VTRHHGDPTPQRCWYALQLKRPHHGALRRIDAVRRYWHPRLEIDRIERARIPRELYPQKYLERDDFSSSRHPALVYCWSMIFSDLASPAEAGFAKAGNRYPLFGIML